MDKYDLFIFAGEDSADLHGKNLIKDLLSLNPELKILCVAGPKMRELNIKSLMHMENFQVMGFIDIIFALPRLIKNFFFIRKNILKYNPKACIFIDYPDFNLQLEKSLRKKGYKNKLIHYISPTIWAWRRKRADFMAKNLDLLITIFPFEKKHYSHTSLDVRYSGHPLAYEIQKIENKKLKKDLIGIFPGSRKKEIQRNFPLQLEVAKRLFNENSSLKFVISVTNKTLIDEIAKNYNLDPNHFVFYTSDKNYENMQKMKFAIATSGTINLELALHKVPSIINFVIKPLDLLIAKNVFKINLPFYCIVNIILGEEIFYELYGPNLTVNSLYEFSNRVLYDREIHKRCRQGCENLINILETKNIDKNAANLILPFL